MSNKQIFDDIKMTSIHIAKIIRYLHYIIIYGIPYYSALYTLIYKYDNFFGNSFVVDFIY